MRDSNSGKAGKAGKADKPGRADKADKADKSGKAGADAIRIKVELASDAKAKGKKADGKKAGKKAAGKKAGGKKMGKKAEKAIDGLSKVIDHPLVSEILAAGALAAVAAVAEHQLGNTNKTASSSKLIQAAGKAAAAAIGARLMNEVGAIRDAATKAARKA